MKPNDQDNAYFWNNIRIMKNVKENITIYEMGKNFPMQFKKMRAFGCRRNHTTNIDLSVQRLRLGLRKPAPKKLKFRQTSNESKLSGKSTANNTKRVEK